MVVWLKSFTLRHRGQEIRNRWRTKREQERQDQSMSEQDLAEYMKRAKEQTLEEREIARQEAAAEAIRKRQPWLVRAWRYMELA